MLSNATLQTTYCLVKHFFTVVLGLGAFILGRGIAPLRWELGLQSFVKRTVARSHTNARRASRARRTWQVNTPRVRQAFVENFSDAPHAQDNLSK